MFTDPTYGISAAYEGGKAESEIGKLQRLSFRSAGQFAASCRRLQAPERLAFSPDEKLLYIADSGFWPNPDWPHHIRAFEAADGTLGRNRVIADVSPGIPDGFRVDVNGNIWTSAGDGIRCITPGGISSARSLCRRRSPMSALEAQRGTACISVDIRRSTPLT